MSHSRRSTLRFVGSSTLAFLAGCSGLSGDNRNTERPSPSETVEVRLSGPDTDRLLFDEGDVVAVGEIREGPNGFTFSVELTDRATAEVGEAFDAVGATSDPDDFEIVLMRSGEEVNRFGISPELADEVADGEWAGRFLMTFRQRDQATTVREAFDPE